MLVVLGIVLVVLGAIVIVAQRTGLPIGRLPGDIAYRGKNTSFYFPLTTCILISVVLSIIGYVINRLSR